MKPLRILLTTILVATMTVRAYAQPDSVGSGADHAMGYTDQHPLVYEDTWDLWPYSFLNEKGEPEGFNVDLVRMLMTELNIPYVVKLKPAAEVQGDMNSGKADLTLALAVVFNTEQGHYSEDAVTLFTQSVVTPRGKPVLIKNFRDLEKTHVTVYDNSTCHQLMRDYGWGDNAHPVEDMREAIQKLSASEDGQIVWNTLSLKWLLRRYHIDNLVLTPVNMPHGEYRFMANDTRLLKQLDEAYARLYSAQRLTPIQNKWFYPEAEETHTPRWVWYFIALALVVLLIVGIYTISYRVQARRLSRESNKRNKRLALIMETSQVRVWTYDIVTGQFTWRNENGMAAYTYSTEEFAQRYEPQDFERLQQAMAELAQKQARADADEEEEVTLQLKARDVEDGDAEMRDFIIHLSVLRRGKDGRPVTIIGTKKDITEELEHQQQAYEQTMRYWGVFNIPMVGIMFFDKDGYLQNINPRACEMFECDHDEIVAQHVHLENVLDTGNLNLDEVDDYFATQVVDIDRIAPEDRKVPAVRRKGKLYNEFRLMTVRGEKQELIGVFAVCRDVSSTVMNVKRNALMTRQVEDARRVLAEYDADIDNLLRESDIRLVAYSPGSHTLTIYRSVGEVQHALTQTRCMTLVDDRSKKLAMRLLGKMDAGENIEITANICTTLRVPGGYRLCLAFDLMPQCDKQGQVTSYLGLCRDLSELNDIELRKEKEQAKVQEVENTKNTFVKNMVQEIRQPMNTVVDYVGRLDPVKFSPEEFTLSKGIMENADELLHLIDNILYLSRLEAHMVEIKRQSCNFAEVFESQCMTGWMRFKNANTRYAIENPYEQLVVDIDAENLGQVIAQLTANAAQHTFTGTVRTRYDYIGRRLMITVDDTGEGIPADRLALINEPGASADQTMKGLGLAICKELVSQMGGNMEISSEEGSGTTVYITVPCHASAIKRKKQLT